MSRDRNAVVKKIESWIGLNEADGSFTKILDIYNAYDNLPRKIKMTKTMSWCACTWSAVAIDLGYTDIMPIEISCGNLITLAKKAGIWVESDAYVAKIGDGILYDWDDSGKGDTTGWPEHVGVVTEVSGGYYVVSEGNYKNRVGKRTISVNGRFIRGFITPKYDSESISIQPPNTTVLKDNKTVAREVILGTWGSGKDRIKNLVAAGYDATIIQETVNQLLKPEKPVAVTSINAKMSTSKPKMLNNKFVGEYTCIADLNLRHDAGTNKKSMTIMPTGTKMKCYGYYNVDQNKIPWYYVEVTVKGITYMGFCHSKYLKK